MSGRKELEQALKKLDEWDVNYWDVANQKALREVAAAAREHLKTFPQTKFIEAWHVEYCENFDAYLKVEVYRERAVAESIGRRRISDGFFCINVTGPHKHEIPC